MLRHKTPNRRCKESTLSRLMLSNRMEGNKHSHSWENECVSLVIGTYRARNLVFFTDSGGACAAIVRLLCLYTSKKNPTRKRKGGENWVGFYTNQTEIYSVKLPSSCIVTLRKRMVAKRVLSSRADESNVCYRMRRMPHVKVPRLSFPVAS